MHAHVIFRSCSRLNIQSVLFKMTVIFQFPCINWILRFISINTVHKTTIAASGTLKNMTLCNRLCRWLMSCSRTSYIITTWILHGIHCMYYPPKYLPKVATRQIRKLLTTGCISGMSFHPSCRILPSSGMSRRMWSDSNSMG